MTPEMQSPPQRTAKDLFLHMADEATLIVARRRSRVNSCWVVGRGFRALHFRPRREDDTEVCSDVRSRSIAGHAPIMQSPPRRTAIDLFLRMAGEADTIVAVAAGCVNVSI